MPKNPLELAKEALDKAIETEKRNRSLLIAIGPAIIDSLRPVLDEILSTFRQSSEETRQAISSIKIDSPVIPEIKIPEIKIPDIQVPETQVRVDIPQINIPEIKIPEIKVPPIKVPKAEITVNVPPIKVPEVKMPDEMEVRGWLNLIGWDRKLLNDPIPVQLRDAKGNPVNLFENLTSIVGSSGGGGVRTVGIKTGENVIGGVFIAPYTSVSSGNKTTTAGTAVSLGSTAIKKVEVTALPQNTDVLVVGGSNVVASSDNRIGTPLFPGNTATIFIDNLSKIYIDTTINGEGVTFTYYV